MFMVGRYVPQAITEHKVMQGLFATMALMFVLSENYS